MATGLRNLVMKDFGFGYVFVYVFVYVYGISKVLLFNEWTFGQGH
jgi:hypothetical protein